jgi:hypothetical protein
VEFDPTIHLAACLRVVRRERSCLAEAGRCEAGAGDPVSDEPDRDRVRARAAQLEVVVVRSYVVGVPLDLDLGARVLAQDRGDGLEHGTLA